MKSRISSDVEFVYAQLLWIERRRFRLVESVSAHFGQPLVDRVLQPDGLGKGILEGEPELVNLLDDREPEAFLADLATRVERHEAATVTRLRSHVSVYREHVDEQILFGARTAGQETGRAFLSSAPAEKIRASALSVPEAVQAIFELNFSGLPGEKNYFLMLRSRGGSTVHFTSSPHLAAWKSVDADPKFLYSIRAEWIRGVLDIISPKIEFSTAKSIEFGNLYGLEHFFWRDHHAGP